MTWSNVSIGEALLLCSLFFEWNFFSIKRIVYEYLYAIHGVTFNMVMTAFPQ